MNGTDNTLMLFSSRYETAISGSFVYSNKGGNTKVGADLEMGGSIKRSPWFEIWWKRFLLLINRCLRGSRIEILC